jgi:hypothetical protein
MILRVSELLALTGVSEDLFCPNLDWCNLTGKLLVSNLLTGMKRRG